MTEQVKWYGDKILAQIRDATPEALMAGGEQLVKAAASRITDRSGVLRNSGYVATDSKSTYRSHKLHNKQARVRKGGAVAGFAAFYARFVEYGTKPHKVGGRSHPGSQAKPFLRPAFDELKNAIGTTIVKQIGRKLK